MASYHSRATFIFVFSFALVATFAPLTGQSQTFFVRTGSGGSGTGSDWTNAYTSLPAGLVRGATYYIADGSYGTYTFDDPTSGSTVTIKKATAADHGTDTGWSDAFGDGVAAWSSVTFNTSDWVFDGVTGGGPSSWKTGHGFTFTSTAGTAVDYVTFGSGVSNITVRHISCTQTGNIVQSSGANCFVNNSTFNNSRIEYSYIDNIGRLSFFFRGGSGNILQYNYSGNICGVSDFNITDHCEALVIHSMSDVHFRWNLIAEAPSSGAFVKNNTPTADAVRIYGNIIGNGFPINCNSGPCPNWRVFNNTFFGLSGGPIGGDGGKTAWLFFNNIIFNGSIASIAGAHDYNWFSRIASMSCNMVVAANENLIRNFPTGCDGNATNFDPFVNSAALDFRLLAPISGHPGTNACALDACTGENRYNVDMNGRTRTNWSRGALEYFAGGPPPAEPVSLRIVP